MADINGNSRLLLSGDQFRNDLEARNLYNPDNQYVAVDKLSLQNKSKVADALSSILSVIPQYANHSFDNSLISRLDGTTPLTTIGTQMLGQQMIYNSASHLAQQNLPAIDLSNVLKGKSPFVKNVDRTITVIDQDSKTLLDKIGGFVGKAFFNTNAIGTPDPFKPSSTNADYIKNTGKGQLAYFYDAVNYNVYKQVVRR